MASINERVAGVIAERVERERHVTACAFRRLSNLARSHTAQRCICLPLGLPGVHRPFRPLIL